MIFSAQTGNTIAALGESQLIEHIRQWLGPASPPAPFGIGDDCALLPPAKTGHTLLTTDSLTHGRHFDDDTDPEKAGAKLIKRNLSDIAAMGGRPGPAVLALLAGPDLSTTWLEAFFDGIREACLAFDIPLTGGDITQTSPGQFSAVLTLTGHTDKPLLRGKAAIGHSIFVTGTLGGSILGKHLNFTPRLEQGQWLAARSDCSALMDLTDGLAKDLPALLADACTVALQPDHIPIAEDARTLARKTGKSPLEHAFTDGEDYELLFAIENNTTPSEFIRHWQARFPELPITCIGRVQPRQEESTLIDAATGKALPWQAGYEHFKSQ